jgi:hypothetical protein
MYFSSFYPGPDAYIIRKSSKRGLRHQTKKILQPESSFSTGFITPISEPILTAWVKKHITHTLGNSKSFSTQKTSDA